MEDANSAGSSEGTPPIEVREAGSATFQALHQRVPSSTVASEALALLDGNLANELGLTQDWFQARLFGRATPLYYAPLACCIDAGIEFTESREARLLALTALYAAHYILLDSFFDEERGSRGDLCISIAAGSAFLTHAQTWFVQQFGDANRLLTRHVAFENKYLRACLNENGRLLSDQWTGADIVALGDKAAPGFTLAVAAIDHVDPDIAVSCASAMRYLAAAYQLMDDYWDLPEDIRKDQVTYPLHRLSVLCKSSDADHLEKLVSDESQILWRVGCRVSELASCLLHECRNLSADVGLLMLGDLAQRRLDVLAEQSSRSTS